MAIYPFKKAQIRVLLFNKVLIIILLEYLQIL